MTTAVFGIHNGNRFVANISGHADYNPHGPDIVCSACSVLCCVLAQSVLDMDADGDVDWTNGVSIENEPGRFVIDFTAKNKAVEKANVLFKHTITGFQMLADQYPENVSLI